MRINNVGNYEYCRWANFEHRDTNINIKDCSPRHYFQQYMAPIRQQMLNGDAVPGCQECAQMEQHGKISGRQRQLLKIGVRTEQFAKTLASSPWVSEFASNLNGDTQQLPQDWQIDLGNYCNSACVMCNPRSSSKIATIGGETLITPAFRHILQALVDSRLSETLTVGFTTNLTVWDLDIIELLKHFAGVHLGMSVECFHSVNDYVRWPSQLEQVQSITAQWLDIVHSTPSWLVQLRTTPTILTISQLLSVYDFAWQHNITVESCNFITNPAHLKPAVLPILYRNKIIKEMKFWLEQHPAAGDIVTNIRNPKFIQTQITQDLQSYINYLETAPDESNQLPALVQYLKLLEGSRGNSILSYLPEYEELFRTAGY